jgi:hypothetical protein
MNEPLDELYLTWLYGQIGSVRLKNPSKTYWSLARQLFTTEFFWIIPNDDNRLADGRDLRLEFIDESEIDVIDPDWMSLGCSMLEMLIALSRRLNFQDDESPKEWFWKLIENLDLEQCTDARYNQQTHDRVDSVLDRIIWRKYDANGHGGLFPLEHARHDQREVEIWYQLSAYLIEQE